MSPIPTSGDSMVHGPSQLGSTLAQALSHNSLVHEGHRSEVTGCNTAAETVNNADERNEVWWDGVDDAQNPYNWPARRKWLSCGLVSAMAFISPLASSMFAPGVPDATRELHSDSLSITSFVVSVYVLGYAAGPLIFAPLSEIYGRLIVYHISNILFMVFLAACAVAPSINSLIAFRFLSGFFGSTYLTNGGGTVSDVFTQEERGAAMAAFSIGPVMGPILGPVAGGFLAGATNWRWTFWLILIVTGVISIAMLFTSETHAPVILARKVNNLRAQTGNRLLQSKLDSGCSPFGHFKRGIIRPLKMFSSLIIIIMCMYTGIAYGFLYLYFTTLTIVFAQTYHFSTEYAGLSFLGLGVGSLLGLGIFTATSDRHIRRKTASQHADSDTSQDLKAEYRLHLLPVGSLLIPVGLLIYGWAAEYEIHWIVPILGTSIIGIGTLLVLMSIQLYLIDAFTVFTASALATNAIMRSVAGAVLPLVGLPMYTRLGLGWGNSLLGLIILMLVPVASMLIKYGETLRKRFDIEQL